jgi:Bacterial archaeo-eukaryotic release factor family 3
MIDTISKDQLHELLQEAPGPCVSIFMPTHRSGAQTLQDPIRLKNLLRQVTQDLTATDLPAAEINTLLKPVINLLDDHHFWQHQSDGLAMFLSPQLFRLFRLPADFQQLTIVADRFQLKPILPLFTGDGRFYVLSLSQNHVRLFLATRDKISEQRLEGIPASIGEALTSGPSEMQLQYHTASAEGAGHRHLTAIYHGREVDIASESNLQQYFRQIDRGVCDLFKEEQVPLILATVEYLVPIYREINHHALLLDEFVRGNPDLLKLEELHSQAWAIAKLYFQKTQEQVVAQYRQLGGTSRTSNDLPEIVLAAHDKRVATLFVALGIQCWGTFDTRTRRVDLHETPIPRDEDLLNIAAIRTYAYGGTVFVVSPDQMPDPTPAAAIFRY